MKLIKLINDSLFNYKYSKWICILILIGEYFILNFIIKNVPYTEIDYSTYMQQILQIEQGERDYSKIGGDTGPIVYPGGYVLIYKIMKRITNGMERLNDGQHVFKWVYLLSLLFSFLLVHGSSNGKLPPYVYVLSALSKRLHSIYVLRLFNDGFTTMFMLAGIVCLQEWTKRSGKSTSTIAMAMPLLLLATALLTFAVTVKMSALLVAPAAFALVIAQTGAHVSPLLAAAATAVGVVATTSWPFVGAGLGLTWAQRWAFLNGAFDVGRVFAQKWSVNWAFLGSEVFLSRGFHVTLLALWTGLVAAVLCRGLCRGLGKATATATATSSPVAVGPRVAGWTCSVGLLAGVLCARSLHYQFLAWYGFLLPWLLWECFSGFGGKWFTLFSVTTTWFIHEWCWNVYPATPLSSAVLVSLLALMVARLIYIGPASPYIYATTAVSQGKRKSV